MSTALVRVRATRAFWARGDSFLVGMVVALPALDAADVLAARRAELVDPCDRAAIAEAVRADVARVLRAERRAPPRPPGGSEWQSR